MQRPTGLTYHDPEQSFEGYTLFCNNFGSNHAYLIDMDGRICHSWHSPEGIGYGYLLPNGNLLLRTHAPRNEGTITGLRGGAASILELDWESNVVWEYRRPLIHLDFERLDNGNTLVVHWHPVPPELAARVQGGISSGDRQEQMMADKVVEVTPAGEVVREWKSWEYLDPDRDAICPLESRREWTHQNAVNVTPEGDLLVSFRHISTIGIVDRATGEFRWKWGPGEISHQHYPTMLENGNILLFDNGSHRPGQAVPYSRVIEVNPKTNRIEWEYKGGPPLSFFSPVISSAERLPNGNTLICEGSTGRLFEVTIDGVIVWEYINPFTTRGAFPAGGGADDLANTVFRAHRYDPDHPALMDRNVDPARYESRSQTRLH